jgi:peptidoglycan/LPS O-acetylase OafA/YrhL
MFLKQKSDQEKIILKAYSDTALMKENNFDLIRLVAATEVALKHILFHFNIGGHYIENLNIFPGVPVFFFVSGFLIFQSYNNSKSLLLYWINRILRIYPALIVCFLITLIIIIGAGYLRLENIDPLKFLIWSIAQLTFIQFYNPDFMRGFGVGVVNGSLWTISVELQFYLLTPILYYFVRKYKYSWLLLTCIFASANMLMTMWNKEEVPYKILMVSFIPWIYMFILGAWISTQASILNLIRRSKLSVIVIIYLAIGLLCWLLKMPITGNEINVLSYLSLALLVVKLACTRSYLSNKLLRKNDISYGVYIYHMPIVNAMIFYGFANSLGHAIITIMATFIFALMSWRFIEKPALGLKKIALRQY